MSKRTGSVNVYTAIWLAIVKQCQGHNPPTTKDELLNIAAKAIGPPWKEVKDEWLLADLIRREVQIILNAHLLAQPIKPGPFVVDCDCGHRLARFYCF